MRSVRGILLGAAVACFVVGPVACGATVSSSSPGDAGASSGGDASGSSGAGSGGSGSGSSSGSGSASGASSSSGAGSSSGSGSGSSSGGVHGDGGATDAGSSSGAPCKRGVGSSGAPPAALAPSPAQAGVSWWYDWGTKGTPPAGIEFVPMIWGASNLAGPLPASAKYVLGFNEPNFKAQSNLTPAQAAADWPKVEGLAKAAGIPLVSPAVNYCGSASDPSGCSDPSVTDPYTWLKDFFAACSGCKVDYVAVHWYNCDLPSLQGYIDGNGAGLEGFVQFGKPIWLTEFCCSGSSTAADQKAYMQAAVPYLEGNPHVYRYSWFSASPIPSAELTNADGTLTDLGATYVSLPQACH
jgi:hypothetical protein